MRNPVLAVLAALWLSRDIGAWSAEGPRGKVTWDRIRMERRFSGEFCPRYDRMKPDDKKDFLIEVFKAVAWAKV